MKAIDHTFLVAVATVLLTQAAFAQTPSGTITSPTFSGPGHGLYDLTGVITDFSEDFEGGNTLVTVSEAVSLVHSITGALTAGTAETTVTVEGDYNFTFPAQYTLKGSIKPAGNKFLMALALTAKGSASINGANHKVSESVTYLTTIDPQAETVTGRKTGTVSASGKGSIKIVDPTISGAVPDGFTPIDWFLTLTVTTTGTKVAGTAAVSLANDRSFPFTVKGTTRAGASKLTLTGTGAGKGAKLTVTLTGNTITGISGTLFGQPVALSGL